MKTPLKTCMLSCRRINIGQFWKSIGEKVGDGCEKWKCIYFLCCPGIWGQSYISAPRREMLCFTEHTQSWIWLVALRSANIYQVSRVPALFVQLSRPPGEVAVSLWLPYRRGHWGCRSQTLQQVPREQLIQERTQVRVRLTLLFLTFKAPSS